MSKNFLTVWENISKNRDSFHSVCIYDFNGGNLNNVKIKHCDTFYSFENCSKESKQDSQKLYI